MEYGEELRKLMGEAVFEARSCEELEAIAKGLLESIGMEVTSCKARIEGDQVKLDIIGRRGPL